MRIAFVNTLYPPYGGSGAEATLRFLVARLKARGHDCSIVTMAPGQPESEGEVDGVPVRYIPLANVFWPYGKHRPRLLRPLFQVLDAYNPIMGHRLGSTLAWLRPDVVHCHNLLGFSVSTWATADALGIPVVQTLHDYNVACPRSAMWRPGRGNCTSACTECRLFATPRRALSYLPYAVTSVSHRVLDRVAAAGVFRDAPRARIIRGNNPEGVSPARPPRATGGPLCLGFMGRLDPLKGLGNLLDALATLPRGAAVLRVAGRGAPSYEAALNARCAGRDDVHFLGHVAPADFFQSIDMLVIPSVWEDPFPRVFHEALAYGVPSLVSPLGGLPEVIEHGLTGFITRAATADGLREMLELLLREGWDREAVRQACLSAAQAYAPDVIVGQYEAVLSAAASRAALPDDAGEPWPHRRVPR